MQTVSSKRKSFYGWVNVVLGILVLAVAVGIVNNTTSLFIRPISDEMGFSRQQMGANQTVLAMVNMIAVFFSGWIYRRYKLMRLMKLGAVILVAAYACYAFASNIYTFYLISLFVAAGQAFVAYMPFAIVIGNWFVRKRGFAIGLTFMGSGLGGMLFNVLAGQWIGLFGWRHTYLLLTCIMAAALLPVVFFLIKEHPLDMGQTAYGADGAGQETEDMQIGPSPQDVVRSPRFIAMGIAVLTLSVALNTLPTTLAPHLSDSGYSTTGTANAVAMMMGVLALSKIALGHLYDRLGMRGATGIAAGALIMALFAMRFAYLPAALAPIVLGAGFGCAFGTVAYPVIAHNTFGNRSYAVVTGVLSSIGGLGSALSSVICGTVFDHLGSYTPAYTVGLFVMAVSMAALIAMLPRTSIFVRQER